MRWLSALRHDKQEIGRFIVVGILNTAIGVSGIAFGEYVLHVNYVWANVMGYALGVTNSFVWNKLWTFKSSSWHATEVVRFLIVFGVSYSAQFLVVTALIRLGHLANMISQLTGMCFYTAANYVMNKHWTFRKGGDRE